MNKIILAYATTFSIFLFAAVLLPQTAKAGGPHCGGMGAEQRAITGGDWKCFNERTWTLICDEFQSEAGLDSSECPGELAPKIIGASLQGCPVDMRNGDRASVPLVQRRCEDQSSTVCDNLVSTINSNTFNVHRLMALQYYTRCDFDDFEEEKNISWIEKKCPLVASKIGEFKAFCQDTLDSLPDLRKEDGSWNWN